MNEEERDGRIDIRYNCISGRHIIIELKRPGRRTGVVALVVQGKKYRDALKKVLEASGEKDHQIEVVFVVENLPERGEPDFVRGQLASVSGRIVYYDQLIVQAQSAYAEYTRKQKDLDRIEKVVTSLES